MRSLLFVAFAAILLGGCAARPLVIDWPEVQVQTNLPLSRQGVVIVNGIVDSPSVYLNISKTGYYGTTIVVRRLPPGHSFFIPADGGWIVHQTMAIVVVGYEIHAERDSARVLTGTATREFSFHNSGYSSRIETWRITRYSLR